MRRVSIIVVAAILCTAARMCVAADAGLTWQQGFPMRVGGQVLLLWIPYPDAESYVVLRKNIATGEEVRRPVSGTQYIDPDAAQDESFSYTVQPVLKGGAFGPVSESKRLEGLKPLQAPKWVGFFQEGKSVRLVWEAVEGAAFYNVYRGEGEGKRVLLASVQEVKHVDGAVTPGAAYQYTVRSVGVQGRESAESLALPVAVAGATESRVTEKIERRYVELRLSIQGTKDYRLKDPTDLVLSQHVLFVTDVASRSVLALTPDGDLLYRFGLAPPEYPGVWGIPWGIDVSEDGNSLAVTFLRSPNVRVFARNGNLLRDFRVGKPPGFDQHPEVPQPMDVSFDRQGGLWVTEYTYGQVVRLGADGTERGRVGKPRFAEDAGPFRSPTFLSRVPGLDQFYVVDSLLAEIFVVDASGKVLRRWRRPQLAEGALNLPKGVRALNDGGVMVVDGIRSALQTFDTEGKILAVYYTKDKNALILRGLVSVALDERAGEIFALSKVDGSIYRLKILEKR